MADPSTPSVPSPTREEALILHTTERLHAAKQHSARLGGVGIAAEFLQCENKECLDRILLTEYSRVDILADETMCNILMEDELLHTDIRARFKDMERQRKPIFVIKFPPGNTVIDDFFHLLPKNARRLLKEEKSEENTTFAETTGISGGAARNSNVAGHVTGNQQTTNNIYILHEDMFNIMKKENEFLFRKIESMVKVKRENEGSTEPNRVKIILQFSEEFKHIIHDIVMSNLSETEGVVETELRLGSIIIFLTLADGYVTTGEWIQRVLRALFNEKIASCVSDRETFRVTVQRHLHMQDNEVPNLDDLYWKSRFHGNCITKTEHNTQTENLRSTIRKLEQDLKTMQDEQLTEAKVWLQLKHCPTGDENDEISSGRGTAEGSVADHDTETDRDRKKYTEETLPAESRTWDVEEGDMRLIVSNRNDMFNEACRAGKVDIARGILSAGKVDINNRSEEGLTPVMIAAWNGHKKMFDFLVQNGSDLSLKLDNGNNLLHAACFGGNVDIIDYVITSKAVDIESRGYLGRTAVMKAATIGQRKVFKLLVKRGCGLSGVDGDGNNILHLACFSDNVEIVKYIINHNIADVDSKGQFGRTSVMKAASKGQRKVFEYLVSIDCDLSGVDTTGNNILHLACFSDNVEIVKYIINHNIADVDSRGQDGATPVMFAAEKGQKKVFEYLVSIDCDLSGVDGDGNNILHLACFSDNVEIVKYIINHNIAAVDSKGQFGRTSVMKAASKGQRKVFEYLVSIDCDLSGVDTTGNNILHLACLSDNVEIVKYIINHNIAAVDSKGQFGRTPVMTAASKGQKKVFEYLVSIDCDLSGVDTTGNNILHLACLSDNVEIVKYIINHNIAAVDSKGYNGRTPVMTAASKGQKKVFEYLVSIDCDLSGVDTTGNNILHLACFSDNVEIVKYIINHNIAAVDSKGYNGRTPVMFAAEKGQKKVFEYLVSIDCDLSGVDTTGNNILHLACFSDNVEIVKYIINHNIAAVDSKGEFGGTPVMFAAEKGQKKVFEYLVSIDCDLSVLDEGGANILHLAAAGGNASIVEQILTDQTVDINSRDNHNRTPLHYARYYKQDRVVKLLVAREAID